MNYPKFTTVSYDTEGGVHPDRTAPFTDLAGIRQFRPGFSVMFNPLKIILL